MTLVIVQLVLRWLFDLALWAATLFLIFNGITGWAIAFFICAILALPSLFSINS